MAKSSQHSHFPFQTIRRQQFKAHKATNRGDERDDRQLDLDSLEDLQLGMWSHIALLFSYLAIDDFHYTSF